MMKQLSDSNFKVPLSHLAWEAGFKSGLAAESSCSQNIDSYSWHSGYIEGLAMFEKIKLDFLSSDTHLFDFVFHYIFPLDLNIAARVNIACNLVADYADEIEITKELGIKDGFEFTVVWPRNRKVNK